MVGMNRTEETGVEHQQWLSQSALKMPHGTPPNPNFNLLRWRCYHSANACQL